jgi:hypothetical protein
MRLAPAVSVISTTQGQQCHRNNISEVRFEVLTAVSVNITVCWDVTGTVL